MEVDPSSKPEELGEEDLVDYEDEDDTTAPLTHKPAENGKELPKKYAHTRPFHLCSLLQRVVNPAPKIHR
jgi:hypothetical protein